MAGVTRPAQADRNIDPLAHEIDDLIRRDQIDLQTGKLIDQRDQNRGHHGCAEIHRSGHAQQPANVEVLPVQRRDGLIDLAQDRRTRLEELPPSNRQARIAQKKCRADLGFEPRQVRTDDGFRQSGATRRLRQRSCLDHRNEDREAIEIDVADVRHSFALVEH